ncbi:FAD-binding oxidoreductase [Nonomuraea sp. NBC_00507]|uniref:NAD(P)/FAD-dependent oxidoreductase n=1 Tax=Nonomuraea sp. NBC_00507 TaxID=2976002 RepID=UPI002E197C72
MNTDAVVIGAGVIGSSIALELARGGWNVVVADRAGGPGHGSTSASSAIVRFNFSTHDGVAMAWEARHCWEAWRDHLASSHLTNLARFHRTGLVLLDVDAFPRQVFLPLFDRVGVPYEEWDDTALADHVPGIDTGRYWPPAHLTDERFWAEARGSLGAVFTPDAGFVDDPRLAAENLATAAAGHGATFVFNAEVVDVLRRRDRVHGVRLGDGRVIRSAVVVNAAGPWSAQLNRLAGVGAEFSVRVRPLRQEVHRVAAPPGPGGEMALGVIIADMDLGIYLRADHGGGLLVGGTEPECDLLHWLDDPDEAGIHPTKQVFDAQVTRAARRLPGLGVPDRPSGIVGVYDVADDWTPIYDRTDLPGFYVAIGTSGNQFKNAPVVGRLMAAIIEGVENGADHDTHPVPFTAEHTGEAIDPRAFSRRRPRNERSSGTVLG